MVKQITIKEYKSFKELTIDSWRYEQRPNYLERGDE